MRSLVIANGEPPSRKLLKQLAQEHDYLVAVDGGIYPCLECGFKPDLLIGDFDSITSETRITSPAMAQIETPNQNQSDLEKTVAYLFQNGTERITVCGALGRRIDHTLVNMLLLCRYPGQITFCSDWEICFALHNQTELICRVGQTLSLIPVSTEVTGVDTRGLKWELKGEKLTKHFVSISNICLKNKVLISFEKGDLVVSLNV